MKANPFECLNQDCPEFELWLIKRRLFFSFVWSSKPEGEAFYAQLCYKGMK
jgi:hypothetical protein